MQSVAGYRPAVVSETRSVPSPPSFDQLFARYQGPLYRHILALVGDPAQAQDLTQDTFLKVFAALPGMRDPVRPAWLYRIATNTAYDALRHRRRLTWVPFAPGDDDHFPAPDRDLPTRLADDEAVRHALARLTPPQRACLLLRAHDGLSIDEIVHAMGMSKGNVKMTLSRAKERFRAAYADPAGSAGVGVPAVGRGGVGDLLRRQRPAAGGAEDQSGSGR